MGRFDEIEEVEKFNPFHDAAGKFSNSKGFSTYSANPKTKAGAMAITRSNDAGHGRTLNVHAESKGESISQNANWLVTGKAPKVPAAVSRARYQQRKQKLQQQQQTQNTQTPAKPKVNYDSKGFADHDDADYHQLYNRKQYFQQQNLSPAAQKACAQYADPNTEPGSLYNFAQNMNFAMVTGQKLAPKYQQAKDAIINDMHNVGYNIKATRYDHAGMLDTICQSAGLGSDYTKVSASGLQSLVGKKVGENKIISVTTNDFKNSSNKSFFQDRAVKISYDIPAKTKGLMAPFHNGDDQGEMLLAPTSGKYNSSPTIKSIKYTGKSVYRVKTGRTYPQVEIELGWDD